MSIGVFMAIVGTVALIPGLYGAWEAIRRRRADNKRESSEGDRIVVRSALELLKPYERKVQQLERDLQQAQVTINDFDAQLGAANKRINTLNDQLADANTEVQFLRLQVKTMSAYLTKEQDGRT